MPNNVINRITMFKIPDPQDQEALLLVYRTMKNDALKDGEPYIVSVTAGPTLPDARNQGYTIAVLSQFKSVSDMEFYDNDCQAHAALKKLAKSIHQGAMMAHFENHLA